MSGLENTVYEFIKSLDENIQIVIHDRSVIYPKEIDLYLPEYKIGIEIDPTATHNSTISLGNWFGDKSSKPISKDYHLKKSQECTNQGVFLLHIFGYEWKYYSHVIKSMLRNLLSKSLHRYYARNLHVEIITSNLATEFLEQNHRQGAATSKINLGLCTSEGELVSLMTFGHTRTSIGRQASDDENTWELVRFCNKLNSSVVGGASKLFKHFLRDYNPKKVISFSDIAHTRGNLYSTLGFTQAHVSDPGYCWVHVFTDLYLNRVSCQKQNLPKLFDEPDLNIVNKTEQQIMVEHGFVQVFDCGTIRWEYTSQM